MAPVRRLEDRIRELAARMVSARDHELESMAIELQTATHEYARRIENRASATVLAWPQFPHERRKHLLQGQLRASKARTLGH